MRGRGLDLFDVAVDELFVKLGAGKVVDKAWRGVFGCGSGLIFKNHVVVPTFIDAKVQSSLVWRDTIVGGGGGGVEEGLEVEEWVGGGDLLLVSEVRGGGLALFFGMAFGTDLGQLALQ